MFSSDLSSISFDQANAGIAQLAIQELFVNLLQKKQKKIHYTFNDDDIDFEESEILSDDSDETDFDDMELKDTISVSILQIYNETFTDLLVPKSEAKPLKMKMDSKKKHFVKGLSHVEVTSATQVFTMMAKAHLNRA